MSKESGYGSGISQDEFNSLSLHAVRMISPTISDLSFEQAIGRLSKARSIIAHQQMSPDQGLFGALITHPDYEMRTVIAGRYEPYFDRLRLALTEKQLLDVTGLSKKLEYDTRFEIDGTLYDLQSIDNSERRHLGYFDFVQVSVHHNKAIRSLITSYFEKIKATSYPDQQTLMNDLATLHWLLAKVGVAKRGSAWIYETLIKALARHHNVELTFTGSLMPDCLAMVTFNLEQYQKMYSKELTVVNAITEPAIGLAYTAEEIGHIMSAAPLQENAIAPEPSEPKPSPTKPISVDADGYAGYAFAFRPSHAPDAESVASGPSYR